MLTALAIFQALNALLVAGVAWYFAHHQKRIALAKLRLDLFDKRFAVFDATRKFIGRGLVTGGAEIEDQNAFLMGVSGASFLLNDELSKYLDEILQRIVDMPFLQNELANAPSEEERKALQAKYLAERKWLREQTRALEAK
jgi:hypothetical protein